MRADPTPAERRLWSMLRNRRMPAAKFRRQHVIAPYIVDFACIERWLIIEADGGQHADSESDQTTRRLSWGGWVFECCASGTMTCLRIAEWRF